MARSDGFLRKQPAAAMADDAPATRKERERARIELNRKLKGNDRGTA